jgi:hypothetical protein
MYSTRDLASDQRQYHTQLVLLQLPTESLPAHLGLGVLQPMMSEAVPVSAAVQSGVLLVSAPYAEAASLARVLELACSIAEASWVRVGAEHSSTGAAAASAALSFVQALLMLPPLLEEVAGVGTLLLASLHWLTGVAVAAGAPYAGVASLAHSWAVQALEVALQVVLSTLQGAASGRTAKQHTTE